MAVSVGDVRCGLMHTGVRESRCNLFLFSSFLARGLFDLGFLLLFHGFFFAESWLKCKLKSGWRVAWLAGVLRYIGESWFCGTVASRQRVGGLAGVGEEMFVVVVE